MTALPGARWSAAERTADLRAAADDGVDLAVIGGGITGAGVLRDAATRGLRVCLLERDDFASGTSGRSSKLVHGGLRYIAQGHLGVTREACRERDLLLELAPTLVRPLPFLFPAFRDSRVPLWQVRAALWIYSALANFRPASRFEMLGPARVGVLSRDLRAEGLLGAGLYTDARVDDARLVLETIKSARALGGRAVNHAEVTELLRDERGLVAGVRVRDCVDDRHWTIRARTVVNAAGPAVERVRGLDRPVPRRELRPAKGVHLVIPRERIHAEAAVTFESPDGRHLFVVPWGDVAIVGTTDAFTEEVDEPVVTIDEVHYLLSAANEAFPGLGLTTNDLRSVFAGVRPLAADADAASPSSSVSREHRIYCDPSGLVSVAGGKLTTYRAMAKRIVDRAVRLLPESRRRAAGPSRTASLPLRRDGFEREAFERDLCRRFAIDPARAAHLVTSYGVDAEALLRESPTTLHGPIGSSHFTLAEIPWSIATECPMDLCDLLEHRVRMAIFAVGQGLPELPEIARIAAEAAGWDEARTREETRAYTERLRRRYQISCTRSEPSERSAA